MGQTSKMVHSCSGQVTLAVGYLNIQSFQHGKLFTCQLASPRVRVWKEPGTWPVLPCPWKSGSITHIKFYILLAGKQATTASPGSKKRYSPGSFVAMATCPKETKEPHFTVGSQFQSVQSMVAWLHVHGENITTAAVESRGRSSLRGDRKQRERGIQQGPGGKTALRARPHWLPPVDSTSCLLLPPSNAITLWFH